MRVALFGGTGYVGSYLVNALTDAQHEPSLLVRTGSEAKIHRINSCRIIIGDLDSEAAIETTLENCTAVIYCVGILREDRKRGITFEKLQYEALVRVANLAAAQGISRILLMSAKGAKHAGTRYQNTKFRAERYLQTADFATTIFQPSVIFGNPRGRIEFATQLYRDMILPPIPAVGFYSGWRPSSGAVLMSPVHIEDVALAFVNALDNPATVGKTYELGGPETVSWPEILRRIANATDRKKWVVPMPIGMMYVAATLLDWLSFFPVTRDQLTMLAEGNVVSSADVESLIGRSAQLFSTENLVYLANTSRN